MAVFQVGAHLGRMRWCVLAVGLVLACGSPRTASPVVDGTEPAFGDAPGAPDGGVADAGTPEASTPDAGPGSPDAGATETPATDGGTFDAGAPDAGSADAGSPDAGPPDAGTPDAGIADAGTADAGTADAGTADAGTAASIDCAPAGEAVLAWKMKGYQNPYRNDYGDGYYAEAEDTIGGLVVTHWVASGHSDGSDSFSIGPDGTPRVAALSQYWCTPFECTWTSYDLSNGIVYESSGLVRSALDGHTLSQFNPAPPDASTDAYHQDQWVRAKAGLVVYVWNDYKEARSLVTARNEAGATVWQIAFPKTIESAFLFDAGITLLRYSYRGDLFAIGPGGAQLYTMPAGSEVNSWGGTGDWFYFIAGDVATFYKAADASKLLSLPLDGADLLVTPSQLYLRKVGSTWTKGTLRAVDPATGADRWTREYAADRLSTNVTGPRVVVIDPDRVLHVLNDDGTDALACKVAPEVQIPLFFSGNRLAIQRGTDLEVYELPF